MPGRNRTLVKGLAAHVDIAEDAAFGFEAHPFSTSRRYLNSARAEAGFRRISIGVQDVGEDILLINRMQTRKQVV
ncbi:MAG: hypothetical protein R3B47_15105 [Bacteroidia bacterium]